MGIGGTADERSWESLQKRARNYARNREKLGMFTKSMPLKPEIRNKNERKIRK